MTYYDYLCRLLEPMRVYRTERGTLSGGELYAAGAVLDEADGAMEYAEQEGVLQTAEGEGLARREKLFSRCPVSVSTALRREAIAALARINADSFTLDAINSTLSGCGIKALAEETEKKGTVKVWFPNTVGVPDEFSQVSARARSTARTFLWTTSRNCLCSTASSSRPSPSTATSWSA